MTHPILDANVLHYKTHMTKNQNYTPGMSKTLKILSSNLDSLIGDGKRFRNDADMGKHTGLGQREIHRMRTQEVVPKINKLDVLSERLHLPIPALVSPNLDILEGSLSGEIREVVRRICDLAYKGILETHDLALLASAVSSIERGKSALTLSSESTKRGTGT